MMKYLLILVLVLSSCKLRVEESVTHTKDAGSVAVQDIGEAVSAISGEYICPEKLNVENLSIDFLGAGVQATSISTADSVSIGYFVRLFYHASLCRDYIEVMRCLNDKRDALVCRDGKKLFDVSSVEEVTKNT